MLAVVKDPAKHGILLEEVAVPAISPWEVLVRVRAVGICGSDQRIYHDVQPGRRKRFILGHEIAGEVVAVGERVSEVALGTPVAIEICVGCGICRHCKVGRVNLCEKLEEFGVTMDGGMTEFVAAPARNIHRLPDGLSYRAAVLADPLACVIRGLEMIPVTSGSWVAVLGPGQMGLLAVQVLKRILRARIVVVGTREDRLALARQMGADETIDYSTEDIRDGMKRIGVAADVIYDPVGGEYAEPALRSIAWKGRYLVVGFAAGDIPKLPFNLPLLKGASIVGVFWGAFMEKEPRVARDNARQLLEWTASRTIKPHISARYPLARGVEALKEVAERRAKGKVLVIPG